MCKSLIDNSLIHRARSLTISQSVWPLFVKKNSTYVVCIGPSPMAKRLKCVFKIFDLAKILYKNLYLCGKGVNLVLDFFNEIK